MAVLTDEDLLPWWVAAGFDRHPGARETDLVPEIPGWLLDAPVSDEEPTCDRCGLALGGHVEGRCTGVVVPAPRSAPEPEPVRWAIPGVWGQEPEPVIPSVGDLVAQAQELIGTLAAVDPSLLPPGQALGEAAALAGMQHQLRRVQLGRTADVAERRLFEHLGFRSAAAWQHTTAPDAVRSDRKLAERLTALPHLDRALQEQSVSFAAATQVGGAVRKVTPYLDHPDGLIDGLKGEEIVTAVAGNVIDLVCKCRFGLVTDPAKAPEQAALLTTLETAVAAIRASSTSQRDRVEQAMVLLAEHLSPGALTNGLEDLVLAIVPAILEDRDKQGADKRGLALKPTSDGTWELSGTLTAECGEQLFAVLAAEARRDPANPEDTAAREAERAAEADVEGRDPATARRDRPEWESRAHCEHGEMLQPDPPALVPRSRSKRLHDAFGRLLERYLSQGLGGVHSKVPVQLTATISERTITNAPGAPPARGATGRPLARSLLRRWWCDAHVTTLLMSRGWNPLGVVHSGRTITGTELKAATVQFDNRCAGDGCCPSTPDPLIPLVPHHIRMHALFGQTSLDETVMACPTLHRDLHTGKKTIRLRDVRLLNEQGWVEEA
ncbi:MAG: HNH endonuclease [Actinomycetota bacterium]|nr:HNH endonuclease [Actinomycetota bacterium]